MLGVSENSEGIPEHKSSRMRNTWTFKSGMQFSKEETKNLLKTARAPFYRETKVLLHPENTLESKEYS
jgi:hypothetical protein